MKTTIYDLLGMIKDNKAPKRILFKDKQWEYSEGDYDYIDIFKGWLFDEYVVTYILNDEVTILETTITLNNSFNYLQKLAEDEIPNKIEKLDYIHPDISCSYNESELLLRIETNKDKINEIIDRINNE